MQLLLIQFTMNISNSAVGNTIYNEDVSLAYKTMWNVLILNCIANSCIWNTCVTWQDVDYKLPLDDTMVSKHAGVW